MGNGRRQEKFNPRDFSEYLDLELHEGLLNCQLR